MSLQDNVEAVVVKMCHEVQAAESERDFLVLGELAALRDSGKLPVPVDLLHVGVLYELNGIDHDMVPGQVELDTLVEFVRRCDVEEKAMKHDAPSYFKYVKEARCFLQVLDVTAAEGPQTVAQWLVELARVNTHVTTQARSTVIDASSMRLLARVLDLDESWEVAVAEEAKRQGLEGFQVSVVETYITAFLAGWKAQLDRIL